MTSPQRSVVGRVLRADLALPEHERVLRCYSSALTTGDNPLWREDRDRNLTYAGARDCVGAFLALVPG